MIRLKRIYEKPAADDGYRVLVDRLWPRGIKKENAAIDLWIKEIAPSNELRKWFGHDPARWTEFEERYRTELDGNPEQTTLIRKKIKDEGTVTLLFAARDEDHNNAVVLRDYLRRKVAGARR